MAVVPAANHIVNCVDNISCRVSLGVVYRRVGGRNGLRKLSKGVVLGIAVVGMVVVAVILLIAVPVLMRVLGEAADRDPESSEGDERDEGRQSKQSGPRR